MREGLDGFNSNLTVMWCYIPGAAGDASDGARLQLWLWKVLQTTEGEESRRRKIQYRRQECLHQGKTSPLELVGLDLITIFILSSILAIFK